jgi:hypothetical protein
MFTFSNLLLHLQILLELNCYNITDWVTLSWGLGEEWVRLCPVELGVTPGTHSLICEQKDSTPMKSRWRRTQLQAWSIELPMFSLLNFQGTIKVAYQLKVLKGNHTGVRPCNSTASHVDMELPVLGNRTCSKMLLWTSSILPNINEGKTHGNTKVCLPRSFTIPAELQYSDSVKKNLLVYANISKLVTPSDFETLPSVACCTPPILQCQLN